MGRLIDYPGVGFVLLFIVLSIATQFGARFLRRRRPLTDDTREDFGVIMAATLTLLGLLIGFAFSMAISRYDQRKNYEEAEANAIGTEYLRADLLPDEDARKVRELLLRYLDQRIAFYVTHDQEESRRLGVETARTQSELWSAVLVPARTQPTPTVTLAVSGMNDVLNSQGYAQAAMWNRIPVAARGLIILVAFCCSVMIGYCARRPESERGQLLILPAVVAMSLFLISDIDAARSGMIRVAPENLMSLAQSLRTP